MNILLFWTLGVLLYTFIEYIHHRWGGHTKLMGKNLLYTHQFHHKDPKEGGVTYNTKLKQRFRTVVIFMTILFVSFFLTLGLEKTIILLTGVYCTYLWSEYWHHFMHHREAKNFLSKWLVRLHYWHHFGNSKHNYGFTSPLWDFVFFSYKKPPAFQVPTRHLPKHFADEKGVTLFEIK